MKRSVTATFVNADPLGATNQPDSTVIAAMSAPSLHAVTVSSSSSPTPRLSLNRKTSAPNTPKLSYARTSNVACAPCIVAMPHAGLDMMGANVVFTVQLIPFIANGQSSDSLTLVTSTDSDIPVPVSVPLWIDSDSNTVYPLPSLVPLEASAKQDLGEAPSVDQCFSLQPLQRTYAQFQWLHRQLRTTRSLSQGAMIPPLPEPPQDPSQWAQQDYREKKRRQLTRYLAHLLSRRLFSSHPDLILFFSSKLANYHFVDSKDPNAPLPHDEDALDAPVVASPFQLLQNLLPVKLKSPIATTSDQSIRGIRLVRASTMEADSCSDDMHWQATVMQTWRIETALSTVCDAMSQWVRAQSSLSRLMQPLGASFERLVLLDFALGDGSYINNQSDRILTSATCGRLHHVLKSMSDVASREIRDAIYHFGDIAVEYRNLVPCLKTVMNRRADALALYDESVRSWRKRHLQTVAAKTGKPTHFLASIQSEEAEAEASQLQAKKLFQTHQEIAEREQHHFTECLVRQLASACDLFVQQQITKEQEKCSILEKAIEQLLHENE